MTIKFKNGASDDIIGPASTLASGVAVGATSMTVAAGTGDRFPIVAAPDVAYVTLQNATKIEIIKITERLAAADTMTIVKAQEGTTDRAWLTGDIVSMRITAAQAESAVNAQDVAAAALAAHTGDTVDAHDASAISYAGGTGISATDVEGALDELATEKSNTGHTHTLADITDEGTAASKNTGTAVGEVPLNSDIYGKHTIWIPAGAMTPRTTSGAAFGSTELTTSGDLMLKTLDFSDGVEEGAQFMVAMPNSWDRNGVLASFYWTAASGSGTVNFGLRALPMSNDDPMDTTEMLAGSTATDTLIAANDLHVSPETASVVTTGAADGDLIFFEVYRDFTSDTLAADAKLMGVKLHYTTDAHNDA